MENPSQVEREMLLLASLLHDIGKLVQRASDEPTKHKHEEWGANWLQEAPLRPELLPPSIKEDVESLIYNHHSSAPIPRLAHLLEILRTADHLSAGERPEKEDSLQGEKGKWQREIPLRSLLSEVHLADKQQPSPSYWPLQPLTENPVFPQPREKAFATRANYQDILTKLNSKIKSIASVPALISLLEELLTFVPSETREVLAEGGEVIGEKDPDISLYDHLRLTSAIALCLYDSEERGFLLVRGDISGVQRFIYTISSKGALKSLRARSLYVELLSNHIPALILERLALPPSNLIFCGGAQFTLLLPNTPEAEKALREVKDETNEWLWENFRGRLYLALQWLPLSQEELNGWDLRGKQDELAAMLEREKLRKFVGLSQLFQPEEVEAGVCERCGEQVYECDICGGSADEFREIEEDVHLCPFCYSLFQLGGEIPKLEKPCFLALPEGDIHLPGARYKLVEGQEIARYLSRAQRLFMINGKPDEAPHHSHIYFLPLACYIKRDEEGNAYDLDEFARAGLGGERIGVLRLDVDHLGKILSRGLREGYSFSRIATLSRFLTIFFKNFIDDMLRGKDVAVVYSGGDDAFIVGAWNDVLESAFEIQDKFSQFTKNPSFTLSAGFLLSHPKMPLYQLAGESGELEESAKESGRDSFGMFFARRKERFREDFKKEPKWEDCYRVKRWKEELLRDFAERKDGHYELKLPRSLLYRLLEISREWQREGGINPYIYLVYVSGRIGERLKSKGKGLDDRWREFAKENLLNKDNIPLFVYLVYWVDLLLREKGGES